MVVCLERGASDLHFGPVDATATSLFPASLKCSMFSPFWYLLTHTHAPLFTTKLVTQKHEKLYIVYCGHSTQYSHLVLHCAL